MKRGWIGVGLVVASTLVIGSCGAGQPDDAADGRAPTAEDTGAAWSVAPATAIDGASPYTEDGITVQVPEGWVTDRAEDEGVVRIMVYDPADELNPVAITVSPDASDEAVDVQADVTWTQLGAAGATELERHPVEWTPWPYAQAITGVVERDDGAGSTFVSISARDEAESVMVSVSAQTAEGGLEESLQYQVLQTVEPAS